MLLIKNTLQTICTFINLSAEQEPSFVSDLVREGMREEVDYRDINVSENQKTNLLLKHSFEQVLTVMLPLLWVDRGLGD